MFSHYQLYLTNNILHIIFRCQPFSSCGSGSTESFEVMKSDSHPMDLTSSEVLILSAAGLISAESEVQQTSRNNKNHMSVNGLDLFSNQTNTNQISTDLTLDPRISSKAENFGVSVSSLITAQNTIGMPSTNSINNDDSLKRQTVLLNQQLAAGGLANNNSSLIHNVQFSNSFESSFGSW